VKALNKFIDGSTLYIVTPEGEVYNVVKGKALKHKIDRNGYHCVGISLDNGLRVEKFVHRLVALAYIPNPNNLETVNHKTGNKEDNSISELEWMSRADNTAHGHVTGLIPPRLQILRDDIHLQLLDGGTIKEIQQLNKICTNSVTAERKRLGIETNRGTPLKSDKVAAVKKALMEGKTYGWIEVNLDVSRRCIAKYKKELASECND